MTANSNKPARKLPVGLIVATLVGAGVVVLAGLYQEHLTSFFTQQGWNPGAAEGAVRSFVAGVYDSKSGAQAAELLDREQFEPKVEGGKLVSIQHGNGMGRRTDPARKFAATSKIGEMRSELLVSNGGRFRVLAKFDNGKWGEYKVRREGQGLKIVEIPEAYSDQAPERRPSEY